MWQLLKNHTGTITNRSAAFSSLGVKMPPSIFEANGNQSLRVLPAFLSPNALLSFPFSWLYSHGSSFLQWPEAASDFHSHRFKFSTKSETWLLLTSNVSCAVLEPSLQTERCVPLISQVRVTGPHIFLPMHIFSKMSISIECSCITHNKNCSSTPQINNPKFINKPVLTLI